MKRILVNLLALASLALALITAAGWVYSLAESPFLGTPVLPLWRGEPLRFVGFVADRSSFGFGYCRDIDLHTLTPAEVDVWKSGTNRLQDDHCLGFRHAHGDFESVETVVGPGPHRFGDGMVAGHIFILGIPVAVVFPLLFAFPFFHWKCVYQTRNRRRHGLCTSCGYDLRGIPDRCPECGIFCNK